VDETRTSTVEEPFAALAGSRYMLLTTYRKDGTPVPTPVEPYLLDGRLFFVTDWRTGKVKRIRRNPNVTVAPCTLRGAPTGPTVHGRIRVLGVDEAKRVGEALAKARPIVYRFGQFVYRLRHKHALYMEVLPSHTSMLVHGTESAPFGEPVVACEAKEMS